MKSFDNLTAAYPFGILHLESYMSNLHIDDTQTQKE